MRRLLFVLFALCFSIAAPKLADAQSPPADEDCPAFVHEALTTLDLTCDGLGRNALCYGNTLVSVTFNEEVGTDVFTKPSDKALLRDVESVETAPLDPATEQWGLALMNVQANVPGTLPGQGVIFILMGDAQLENEVEPTDLQEGVTPIEVVVAADINLRSAPSLKANVLASGFKGVTFSADLRSPDGEWLRVRHNTLPVWIHRSGIVPVEGLDSLPNPTRTEFSPMQSFQFTGGIGSSTCKEASGSLLIQGPNDVVVDLEANGARIRLASTILLKQENNTLSVTTLSGAAKVGDVIVPAGFTTQATVNEDNKVANNAFIPAQPVEKLEDLEIFSDLPETTMNYDLDLEQAANNQEIFDPEELPNMDESDFGFDGVDCDLDPTHIECLPEIPLTATATTCPAAGCVPVTPTAVSTITATTSATCENDPTLPECATPATLTPEPCVLNPTAPECVTPETETPDPCVLNPTDPACGFEISATPEPCVLDPTLPQCATPEPCVLDPSLPECLTPEPCLLDPTLPECITPEPCLLDPTLPECITPDPCIVDPATPGCVTPDPCLIDPTLPECGDNSGGGEDPCVLDPTLPQCVPATTEIPDLCGTDPSLPQCAPPVTPSPQDPCVVNPTLPECQPTAETPPTLNTNPVPTVHTCETDPTLPECNPAPTTASCETDPTMPECTSTEEPTPQV
jgi:hypothetical protein